MRSSSCVAKGFRFVALADDKFYPVTVADLAMAERQGNGARLQQLRVLRAERVELMARLADLSPDMVFFTQITRRSRGRYSDHAPLADPAVGTAKGVCAASGDDVRRDTGA